MNVLVCHRPGGAFGYISDGWINALRDGGLKVKRWDGKQKSWKEFSPDLYIGCSGHKQPIPKNRNCPIALHTNPYGPIKIEPSINENKETVDWVLDKKPEIVFGYGHETDAGYWSGWKKKGLIWIPMPTAGDAVLFNPKYGDHKKYDFAFIGGRWKYKAKVLDRYLLPALKLGLNYKLHGWGEWSSNICDGRISDQEAPKVLASCKVGPCVSEPHTLKWGIDVPERIFKVILSGAIAIHDPVPGIERHVPNVIVGHDEEHFLHLIEQWSKVGPDMRIWKAQEQFDDVMRSGTYHHRMVFLLNALGFTEEAEDIASALYEYEWDPL